MAPWALDRAAFCASLFLGKELHLQGADLDDIEFLQCHGLFDGFAINLGFRQPGDIA